MLAVKLKTSFSSSSNRRRSGRGSPRPGGQAACIHGKVAAVIDVEFSANTGITVLFGHSGAGKTTILRSIAGIVTPDEGRIALDDRVYFDSSTRTNLPTQQRRVGYVFQEYALFPHMTARQNIAYAATSADRVRELISMLGLEQAAERRPDGLSGGEQQRVALARALASQPQVLLLDEPLSAVDLATRSRLLDEIATLQRKSNIPFLYVTHSHSEAARVGDHLFVLHEGRIVQSGRPLEVLNAPRTVPVARAAGTENLFVGKIVEHKPDEGITVIDLGGCRVEATYNHLATGTQVTVGIRSEDIIVARERLTQTSARNVIEGTVRRIIRDVDTTELVVSCGVDFKVSITAATIRALELSEGTNVFLLIKARAFHLLG